MPNEFYPFDPSNESFPFDEEFLEEKVEALVAKYLDVQAVLSPTDFLLWRIGRQLVQLQRLKRSNGPDVLIENNRMLIKKLLAEARRQTDDEPPVDPT